MQTAAFELPERLRKRPFYFFVRQHWRVFTIGAVALLLTDLLDILPPLIIKIGVDFLTGHAHPRFNSIGKITIILLSVLCGVAVFRYLWRIYFGRFNQTVADELRSRIFQRLTILGPSFFQKNTVGQLMSLINNDVNSFRMAVGPGFVTMFDAIFLISMILPMMFMLSVSWTLKCLILMPILPFFINKMENFLYHSFRECQDRFSDVSSMSQEIISGIRVIKGYAQEQRQTELFNQPSRAYQYASDRFSKGDASFHPAMEFSVAVGSVILLLISYQDVASGLVSIGTFFAFHQYIRKMVWPMTAIGVGVSFWQQGLASFQRILQVLETPSDIPDTGQITLDHFEKLEVRNLTFQYPGSPVPNLKNISFTVLAGETIGLVGKVGSGKSTLVELLCRVYPAPPKTIFINDHAIEDIHLNSLYRLVSLIPQDPFLFSMSIEQNIALGLDHPPSSVEISSAVQQVYIQSEIENFPEQINSYLGERGINISGGQKQRLAIARALIRKSPLLILDDALSAVDANTEKNIMGDFKRNFLQNRVHKKQTTLIVSHRISSLQNSDRIFVIDHGQIEAIGSHEELLENNSLYQNLSLLQQNTGVHTL